MRRPPMIGLGTGRCGTKSLAEILSGCNNVEVTHEEFVCPWYVESCPKSIIRLVEKMDRLAVQGVLCGEVGAYLLPYLEIIREAVPDLKVVWLERSKKDTVESFMRWCMGQSRLRPQDKVRLGDEPAKVAPLPMIDAATPQQSWEFYWEMYNEHFKTMQPSVWYMVMEALNDDKCLEDLFSYLEIPEEDQEYPDKRCYNSFEEMSKEMSGAITD